MQFIHHAGEIVPEGLYWDAKAWRFTDVRESRRLPREKSGTYFRVPEYLPMLAGPLLGLFYIVVLPFAAVVYLGFCGARRVITASTPARWRGAHRGAGSHH